jgi:hypothetical protein
MLGAGIILAQQCYPAPNMGRVPAGHEPDIRCSTTRIEPVILVPQLAQ